MSCWRTYRLCSPSGLEVYIANYGAKILRLLVPDDKGEKTDVVLGFASPEEWMSQERYFNAVIGRCANRIKDGRFSLEGKDYQLPCNSGGNSLHGGVQGFNAKWWDEVSKNSQHLTLHYQSKDGEEGYPGNLDVYVTYRVENNDLSIIYEATTDRSTIVNLTNHAYFNLHGEHAISVRDHALQVLADAYTPFDETACPTGAILPVEGTPMDFRQPCLIGERIDDPFFAPGRGIDNNWVLRPNDAHGLQLAAVLSVPERTMEVWTTCPALQVYTGNYVERHAGKSGTVYAPQNAVCLETQNIPDAIHHSHFSSPVLRPNEQYREQTVYRFR